MRRVVLVPRNFPCTCIANICYWISFKTRFSDRPIYLTRFHRMWFYKPRSYFFPARRMFKNFSHRHLQSRGQLSPSSRTYIFNANALPSSTGKRTIIERDGLLRLEKENLLIPPLVPFIRLAGGDG